MCVENIPFEIVKRKDEHRICCDEDLQTVLGGLAEDAVKKRRLVALPEEGRYYQIRKTKVAIDIVKAKTSRRFEARISKPRNYSNAKARAAVKASEKARNKVEDLKRRLHLFLQCMIDALINTESGVKYKLGFVHIIKSEPGAPAQVRHIDFRAYSGDTLV